MTNKIYGFQDEHRWLSNFWDAEIVYEGITYPTVEHYYVAMKSKVDDTVSVQDEEGNFSEVSIREVIAKLPTAGKAKRYGRDIVILRDDWDEVKVDVMREGINQKFNHPHLKEKLLATGNIDIIEANTWGDVYWGVDAKTGEGKNTLGELIMEKRNELRKGLEESK